MEDYKFLFKIVLIGNAGVGKTCLVRRFTQGLFPPGQGATIGVDFMIKTVDVDGDKVKEQSLSSYSQSSPQTVNRCTRQDAKDYDDDQWTNPLLYNCLQIWDTAGQERFRSITQSYYRSAHALILVYDVTSRETFDCLPEWLKEIEQYANQQVITVLVGNKIDLTSQREVPPETGLQFAQANNMAFLEASAKEAENVETVFMDLARELTKNARKYLLRNTQEVDPNITEITGETTNISYGGCCGSG
ncbi:Ras- protein Rab-30 [Branchiostoma belcheri]|nr:Ras- protein Rab-30 [Branchiostoma belcheri]